MKLSRVFVKHLIHYDNKMCMGISIRSQPWCTKVIADFDEIFSVCRAFNFKLIDKKIFSKRLCFDRDKWKIL